MANGRLTMAKKRQLPTYAMCMDNDGYPASLERRKVYRTLTDKQAAARDFVRVIDESGEDYLYPARSFVVIEVPQAAACVFGEAS